MIAQIGAAFGTVDLPQALLQRLAEAAQLGAERALLGQHHLAEPAAAHLQGAHREVGPVDEEDADLGVIEQSGT
jgi:hypothetical protein